MSTLKQKKYETACKNGDLDTVKKLLNNIDIKHDKYCGFINACEKGHFDIIKYHVDNCKKLNINTNKSEPFVMACWNNHLDIAKYLLELGGNRTRKVIAGGAPLTGCYNGIDFISGAQDTFSWLLDTFGPNSDDALIEETAIYEVIMNCVERGEIDIFKQMIEEYDIDIIEQGIDADIIKWSCRNYNYDIIKYCVDNYGTTIDWHCYDNLAIKHLTSEAIINTCDSRKIVNMLLDNNIFTIEDFIPIIEDCAKYEMYHNISIEEFRKLLKE